MYDNSSHLLISLDGFYKKSLRYLFNGFPVFNVYYYYADKDGAPKGQAVKLLNCEIEVSKFEPQWR